MALALLIGVSVLTVLVAVHWYLWRRLVKDVSRKGGPWRRTGTVLVWLLPATTVATLTVGRSGAPFAVERVLAWPGYLWLALLLYLTLALLLGELVRPLLLRALARRPTPVEAPALQGAERRPVRGTGGEAPDGAPEASGAAAPEAARTDRSQDASRRLFVARSVAIGAATLAAGTVTAGTVGVLNGPTTKRVTVTLPRLPRRAHGYRIAVVSDVHLGPILGRAHTRRIVEAINATQPDLVAIVGDLVDGTVADLGPAAEPLTQLRSRHGSFFVTGNHEYFGDARSWIDHLRDLGIHPLENQRRELPGFDLAGVNDVEGERAGEGPDFRAALGDRDPARASVLLAHQPVQIHDAVEWDVGLQLSGHTHGGQLWPGPYLAELPNPTVAGLERYGDTQLYVTRGAGTWGPPVRVGAESDITVVTLSSPDA
ncbi:metallophosphoesterase [Streptomyces sp. RKND-216]|uniref:metallophosphoesterase n=1 Tax=Streptomyces sp. RKND-216 TaxID=2562581 RepID=UPI00109E2CBA|nr:metallophosphoesterase [Streptomyces sp. RKND-216]THA24871.1 metallophosphoesterase [Streptomyces sp. RKND-216]